MACVPQTELIPVGIDPTQTAQLRRVTREEIDRRSRKLLRQLNFEEKISQDPVDAVRYLQSKVSETFDHGNPDEANEVCVFFCLPSFQTRTQFFM